jgi:hypothetical protein
MSKSKALSKLDKSIKIYGDQSVRMKKPPTENAEQITIFNTLRRDYPELARLATHIKNEGKKTIGEAQKDAQMGLNAGFSDIVIIGTPTFLCELKKCDPTKSKISIDQETFLINSQDAGAFACVALGHKGFIEAFTEWLKLQ